MAVLMTSGGVRPNRISPLNYIQSSGTQYIDTGIKPNQNTKVVVDFECASGSSSDPTVFGAWKSQISDAFVFLLTADLGNYYGFYGTNLINKGGAYSGRHTVTADKNTWSIDDVSVGTFSAATFQCSYPMFLFAYNNGGSAGNLNASIKIFSCQIYDNGALVRDFVPRYDQAGVACLYDKVEKKYYYNAGTGTFTAG